MPKTPKRKPPQAKHGRHEEIDLTPDDEAALDRAWATITDADIQASIKWLDEIKKETPDNGH